MQNVAYQVALVESAKADANQIFDWVTAQAPIRGPKWFEELMDCLYSLEELPALCILCRHCLNEFVYGRLNDPRRISVSPNRLLQSLNDVWTQRHLATAVTYFGRNMVY